MLEVEDEAAPATEMGVVDEMAEQVEVAVVGTTMTTTMMMTMETRHLRPLRDPPEVLNDAEMQKQLAQILQDQRQTAAGRRIAGITTTNTITTTYKNGRRPTVTRNSTSVRN